MATGQDPTYSGQSKVYTKQQPAGTTFNGNTIVTEEVSDTGSLQSSFGVSAVNGVVLPAKVGFAIAPGAATVCNVTITAQDGMGSTISGQALHFDVFLVDTPNGIGQTATTASGAVTTTTGNVTATYTAKKALYVEIGPTGTAVLSITDTARTGFYLSVVGLAPVAYVSRQLLTADYG